MKRVCAGIALGKEVGVDRGVVAGFQMKRQVVRELRRRWKWRL